MRSARLAARPVRGSSVAGPRAGFSLLELLLVMLIMGIVLGMGVGIFASFDVDSKQDASRVRGVLRAAASAARAREVPARVEIDVERGRFVPRVATVIGTWDFERDGLEGAFGIGGFGVKTKVAEGRLGRALELPLGVQARAELAIEGGAAFDLREGFAISCSLYPESSPSAHAVNVGNACGIYVLSNGGVRAWFAPIATDGEASPHVVVDSEPGLLELERWSRVRAEYDRRELSLFVDGERVASVEETATVGPVAPSLMLGGGRTPYEGRIDELVVSAWVQGEAVVLSESGSLPADAPELVAFDATGRLDRRVHAGPVDFFVRHARGSEERVRVGVFGVVE